MPNGTRGEKRPADVIGNAVEVMRIAAGEEEDESAPIASAAAQPGELGRAARARNLTTEQRSESPAWRRKLVGSGVLVKPPGCRPSIYVPRCRLDAQAEPAKKRGAYKPRQPKAA